MRLEVRSRECVHFQSNVASRDGIPPQEMGMAAREAVEVVVGCAA